MTNIYMTPRVGREIHQAFGICVLLGLALIIVLSPVCAEIVFPEKGEYGVGEELYVGCSFNPDLTGQVAVEQYFFNPLLEDPTAFPPDVISVHDGAPIDLDYLYLAELSEERLWPGPYVYIVAIRDSDGRLIERAEKIYLIGGPAPPPPPPTDPLLYMPFEDPDPLEDQTGNHEVTEVFGDPEPTESIIGDAYTFDGDDYLQTSLDPSSLTQLSIDYYVNFDEVKASKRPMGTESYYWSGILFNLDTQDRLEFYLRNTEASQDSFNIPGSLICKAVSPLALKPNQWYRVTATWDGTQCTLDVAGSIITSQNEPGASTNILPGTLGLGFGNSAGTHLKGSLDEVYVYDIVIPLPECDNDGVCDPNESLATCINDCSTPIIGPQLYYDFEEPNPLEDKAGNNDGTPIGNPQPTTGDPGQAYHFNGTDHIQTPLQLNTFEGLTIDLKVNLDEINPGEHILTGKYGGYNLALSDGKFDFALTNEQNQQFCRVRSDVKAQVSQWHHVIATFDRETCSLLVDGQLTTGDVADIPGSIKSGPLYLAAHSTLTRYYLHGSLDEVKIYDQAIDFSPFMGAPAGAATGRIGPLSVELAAFLAMAVVFVALLLIWMAKRR